MCFFICRSLTLFYTNEMKNMNAKLAFYVNLFFILFISSSLIAFSEDNQNLSWEKIENELQILPSASPLAFSEKFEHARQNFNVFFDNKLDQCMGNSGKDSKKDNDKCLNEAREWKKSFLKLTLKARKSFLEKIHQERLEDMQKSYDEALNQLNDQSWYKKIPFAR